MTPRDWEEYRALRDTIRERGNARFWLFLLSLVAWGGLTIATAALATLPVATLLPLLVLAGGFEALHALTIGIERIGRYIQVFHEAPAADASHPNSGVHSDAPGDASHETEPGPPLAGWEHTAMAFGQAFPGHSPDPVFSMHFAAATLLNFVPVLLAEPTALEVTVVGSVHLLFLLRLVAAKRTEGRQRAVDLDRFQRIKSEWLRNRAR